MFSFWRYTDESPNERLMRVLKMSEGDLRANRKGKMTTQQIKALKRRIVWHFMLEVVPILVVSIVLGTMFMAPGPEPVASLLAALVLIIILMMIIWIILGHIQVLQDCRQGSVVMSQGVIQRKAGKNTQAIIIYPAKLRFSVFSDVYGAFIDGQEYMVYYTPRSKRLVAAEFLAVARTADVSSHPLYGHLRD